MKHLIIRCLVMALIATYLFALYMSIKQDLQYKAGLKQRIETIEKSLEDKKR